jgi:acetyl/propionyl-CoA carboxylase alpha subunit
LREALNQTILLGLKTNQSYLASILKQPAFVNGETTTSYLAEHPSEQERPVGERALALIAAALARYQMDAGNEPGYWRNNPGAPIPYRFEIDGDEASVTVRPERWTDGEFAVMLSSGENLSVTLYQYNGVDMTLVVDGAWRPLTLAVSDDAWWVRVGTGAARLMARPQLPEPHRPADAGGSLRAPMPGRVLAVLVAVGQAVEEGQPLMKLEAMKMEHTIRTAAAGVVEAIYFAVGDQVAADEMLVRIAES